jgi:hypothetical protein
MRSGTSSEKKKEKNCDENNQSDARCGDNWDHVAIRTLRRPDGQKGKCSPAMAAGLTDHLWTMREWLQVPVCKLE